MNHMRHFSLTPRQSSESQPPEGTSLEGALVQGTARMGGASVRSRGVLIGRGPLGGRLVTMLASGLSVALTAGCASTPSSNGEPQPTDTTTGTTTVPPAPSTSTPTPAQTSAEPPPAPTATPPATSSSGETSATTNTTAPSTDPITSAPGATSDESSSDGVGNGGLSSADEPSTGGDEVSTGGARTPVFHVFLLLGQSNMAGYPKAQAADKVEDPRVRVLGFDACAETGREEGKWDIASPPLHECWNGAVGPGDHFAKVMIESLPEGDTIGLVPCAISGEKIETFAKNGGSKYSWILSRAQAAQAEGGVIDGILFHQGESNTGDPNWPGKVKQLVTDLRADLGIGDVPFLAGELAPTGNSANHNTLVNQLSSLIDNGFVVSAQGLKVDPADTQWNLHFDHDSVVTFGQRYAATMLEALGW